MNIYTRQRLIYLFSDYIAIYIAWLLFNIVRYSLLDIHLDGFSSLAEFLTCRQVLVGQIIFPIFLLAISAISGYYNNPLYKSKIEELINTITVTFIGVASIYFTVLINDNIHERMTGYELIGTMWLLFFIFSYFPRLIITSTIASRVSQRKLTLNTLIIGASENALELYNRIKKGNQSMGFDILGFVETDEQSTAPNLPLTRYKMSDIENLSKKLEIQNFIIAPIPGDFSKTINIINRLFPLDCAIYINPDLYHLITSKVRIGYISGEPLIDISKPTTPAYTQNIKRLADIIVASLSLIVLSPLLLYIAIAVKRDSEGPVIYKQERIGLHKRPFKILKFRSMRIDAESESGPTLSNTNDNRITKIGHFLRKYRLDELPQFWNVIKGDMSLVGPRPEREYYIKQIITRAPYYALIHQVRPGITSWGMVKYGYASTVDAMIERLKYDLIYIENISMVVDLKILLYTINTVITGKGI